MIGLLKIYVEFAKMGAVTFGGGYAMLPILRRTCVQKHGWVTEEKVMDIYAISQGLPGVIAANVAVFIGRKLRGLPGSIAAALGCATPCLVIITAIAMFMTSFQDNVWVRRAMSGISICVAALIIDSVIALWRKGVRTPAAFVICAAVFAVSLFADVSPAIVVLIAAAVGWSAAPLLRKDDAR